jgi:D-lactate dehydrogenase (cytochrome)
VSPPPPPLIRALGPEDAEYLRDESRLVGRAETISFPCDETEVREVLRSTRGQGIPVTAQGGRTGITGGAVPEGGHVLNLGRMNRILGLRRERGVWLLRVQPGLPLVELNRVLVAGAPGGLPPPEDTGDREALASSGPLFFPPDPTETTATLGGMACTNASGARSLAYGPLRGHAEALRLVLADGDVLSMRRGRERARGLGFRLLTESGRELSGTLPGLRPPAVKNAAGLFALPDMDLLDLVIGAEGTLGVITELELRLSPLPPEIWAVQGFFPEEAGALRFAAELRDSHEPAALEFFDGNALRLLGRERRSNPAFAGLPEPPPAAASVYAEFHSGSVEQAERRLEAAAALLEACGGDPRLAWSGEGARGLEPMKVFRHALPEAVNLTIDRRRRMAPGITKLGTDLAVPAAAFPAAMAMYRRDLAESGLEYVIAGHIGDNHVHVNMMPRSEAEYAAGREMALAWAERAVAWGGTVSAEHGIGKLKGELLRKMYGSDSIAAMGRLITLFNPGRRLNRGNML